MNKWIGGIVNAGGESVKVWNIVGEPLDKTMDANTFNWGEYLGEVEYARTGVKQARDTAKIDLNLFVSNTFNQSDEMGQKADELIALVKSWEADDVTRIDGYNILLHAVYSKDATSQKANEKMISELFDKLAQTGKLIRVSDLSMMVEDTEGKFIQTSKLTADERSAAANYIAFIMKEYRKTIASDKQYKKVLFSLKIIRKLSLLLFWLLCLINFPELMLSCIMHREYLSKVVYRRKILCYNL